MTYTGTQIYDAINAWAESAIDADIADSIKWNLEYNAKYDSGEYAKSSWYRPQPVKVEEFDREEIQENLAESFYNEMPDEGIELPGLGLAKLVDSYGGEGKGEEYWIVFSLNGEHPASMAPMKARRPGRSSVGMRPW